MAVLSYGKAISVGIESNNCLRKMSTSTQQMSPSQTNTEDKNSKIF